MASKNWMLFEKWKKDELLRVWSPDEPVCLAFLPFISADRSGFNFRALGREAKMPEAAIRQNDECRKFLAGVHQELIALSHMVPKGDDSTQTVIDNTTSVLGKKGELTSPERVAFERLKEEHVRLTEELRSARDALMRYGKMEEYLAEFGVMPR
jgi:hypothetical protein